MKTEMDMEMLTLRTNTRFQKVQEFRDQGIQVDWKQVEDSVTRATADLELDRTVEPFRQAGRAVGGLVTTIAAIGQAFSEGYEEGSRG